jgi:hypothetical protein
MRIHRSILVASLLATCLLIPGAAAAKRPVAAFGRLGITNVDGSPLSPSSPPVLGFVVIANPGLEKTITIQIPPYAFPVVVDVDLDDRGNSTNLDTLVVLTNVSGAPLTIRLTLLGADGTPIALASPTLALGVDHTVAVALSSLL